MSTNLLATRSNRHEPGSRTEAGARAAPGWAEVTSESQWTRTSSRPIRSIWGRTRLCLRCTDGGGRWNVFLPVTIKAFGPAWVLRDNVVRDVRIATLAAVGSDRSFIAGPFESRDEVIVSSSQILPDGTAVTPGRASAAPTSAAAGDAKTPSTRPTLSGATPPAAPKKSGF